MEFRANFPRSFLEKYIHVIETIISLFLPPSISPSLHF